MTPPPGASAAMCRRLVPSLVLAGEERPIEVDQTNRSVVVDEAVIVKWFAPPVLAPHPGAEVVRLLGHLGFDEVPTLHAVEEVDGWVIATISELVPGAIDGWEWFVDELLAGDADAVLASARRIGALAGRLHFVLGPAPTPVPVAAEIDRCRCLLDRAQSVATGEAAEVLAAAADRIRPVFDGAPTSGRTPAIPIHGDLHVGQLLRSDDRLVVTDFDGNPLTDPGRRHEPRPAVVDVASLVQSIDHSGRVAQRRRPGVADELIDGAVTTTLDSYRATLGAAGRAELLDERLLNPLRVAQELHELVYAAEHLPRWAWAPTATLRTMFRVAG